MTMTPVSIVFARQTVSRLGLRGVIVLSISKDGKEYAITSAGDTTKTCATFAKMAELLGDEIDNAGLDIHDIYEQPGFCQICGCCECNPCEGDCDWANKEETLCAACKEIRR